MDFAQLMTLKRISSQEDEGRRNGGEDFGYYATDDLSSVQLIHPYTENDDASDREDELLSDDEE